MSNEQQSLNFEDHDLPLHALPLNRPLVFFDLETTGLDMQMDRIVQFAFIRLQVDKQMQEWQELVNPGIPIPPEATQVHHISDAMVADKPPFKDFAPRVQAFIAGCDLAGFNVARFDIPFLQAEMERNGQPLSLAQVRIVDAQSIFHRKEPRDLTAAYRFYCYKELTGAHDALADVRATLEVLDGQLQRYADLPHDVTGLAQFCAPDDDSRFVTPDRKFYWRHREAIFSFGKYRGKSLNWVHQNDPDYLQWLVSQEWPEETRRMLIAAQGGIYPKNEA